MYAITNNTESLEFASEKIKQNRDIVLYAVKKSASVFYYVSEFYQNDKEIILTSVSQFGLNLMNVHILNKDKDVVLAAVKQDGCSLFYAGKKLKNDEEIVLTAISNDELALKYSSKYKRNRKYYLMCATSLIKKSAVHKFNDMSKINQKLLEYKNNLYDMKINFNKMLLFL